MKQSEFKPCAICRRGVMHNGNVWFYRASVSHMVFDIKAIQQQRGVEAMMQGNAALAQAFGFNDDLAVAASTVEILICADCALNEQLPMAAIMEGEE